MLPAAAHLQLVLRRQPRSHGLQLRLESLLRLLGRAARRCALLLLQRRALRCPLLRRRGQRALLGRCCRLLPPRQLLLVRRLQAPQLCLVALHQPLHLHLQAESCWHEGGCTTRPLQRTSGSKPLTVAALMLRVCSAIHASRLVRSVASHTS